ncbi:MAG TPA: hypothetical protein VIL86_00630 [Tepidisphaeraceae bacterium]
MVRVTFILAPFILARVPFILAEFMRWLTLTHTHRLHAHRHSTGSGHLYQGRFRNK